MQYSYIFIFIISLTIIKTIILADLINDEAKQISSSSLPFQKPANMPECLSKNQLSNMLNRDRRASISRPYFHHWRPARDSTRYSAKNSLAFSPRLGKRSYEDEQESDESNNKFAYRSVDLETFLAILTGHLQEKKIHIVYEDSTKICLSQSISDSLIQQLLDKIDANRRDQNTQEKEEIFGRQSSSKHPILFRYRLG
ncbi:hypothetical protein I4U23_025180 [Adineta vaga]|nr:hypothetical protein I4U23_025180 [Adineta vaga]